MLPLQRYGGGNPQLLKKMSNIENMKINMALYSAMRGVLSNEECLAVIDSLCQALYCKRDVEGLTQKEQSFFEPLLKEATE